MGYHQHSGALLRSRSRIISRFSARTPSTNNPPLNQNRRNRSRSASTSQSAQPPRTSFVQSSLQRSILLLPSPRFLAWGRTGGHLSAEGSADDTVLFV